MTTYNSLAEEVYAIHKTQGGDALEARLEEYRTQFVGLLNSQTSFAELGPEQFLLLGKLVDYLKAYDTNGLLRPQSTEHGETKLQLAENASISDEERLLREALLERTLCPYQSLTRTINFWSAPPEFVEVLAHIECRTTGFPITLPSTEFRVKRQSQLMDHFSEYLENVPADSQEQLLRSWLNSSSGDVNYLTNSDGLKFFALRQKSLNAIFKTNVTMYVAPVRKRRKIAVILPKFKTHTETYVTLPFFASLDPERYETFTFVEYTLPTEQDAKQRAQSEHFYQLPKDIGEAIALMQACNLDIAIFASNLTIGTTPSVIYAHHRVAPIQIATSCCPMTTGLNNMDYMLSGSFTEPEDSAENYLEELLLANGPAHAFDFQDEEKPLPLRLNRQQLGFEPDDIVYISGANAFKITHEYLDAMLEILTKTPNSKLLLYPFNPNWREAYDTDRFLTAIENKCDEWGINSNRIKVLPKAFPDRRGVLGLLRISDIYLDSFYHSGATSAVDPLVMGLPIVTHYGHQARSRQALALLKSLDLEEYAHVSASTYIEQAIQLGKDQQFRLETSRKVRTAMMERPKFLDPEWFSQEADRLFQEAIKRTLLKQESLSRSQPDLLTQKGSPSIQAHA